MTAEEEFDLREMEYIIPGYTGMTEAQREKAFKEWKAIMEMEAHEPNFFKLFESE